MRNCRRKTFKKKVNHSLELIHMIRLAVEAKHGDAVNSFNPLFNLENNTSPKMKTHQKYTHVIYIYILYIILLLVIVISESNRIQ